MSDAELERLKHRWIVKMMRRLQAREAEEAKRREREGKRIGRLLAKGAEERRETEDPKKVLSKVLVDRAWEVLEAAEQQYPKVTRSLEAGLARLVSAGKLKGPITGGQLLWFFRRLGMSVRLERRIRVLEHGELKTIGEKLRGSPR